MTEPSGTTALVAIICSAFVVGLIVGVLLTTTTTLRVLGYYACMIPLTVAFLMVGTLFLPIYIVVEAWRRRGERKL